MKNPGQLTPTEIVAELDKFIIGQDDAKRAVAIAIRNRWRRLQLGPEIRDEVAPKNIIMVGPTGVGKTEIARRLATLVGAPFVKVEATKFTEVGYVGRDVESMVRDLVERAIQMIHEEQTAQYRAQADEMTEQRILDYLLPGPIPGPDEDAEAARQRHERTRQKFLQQLRAGTLDDRQVEIAVDEKAVPVNIFSSVGLEQMEPEMQNFLDRMMPGKSVDRALKVREARPVIHQQELEKLIDQDKMIDQAIRLTEESGIIFLDEIDKVTGGEHFGPDVSREGVQRDLLPMVEGSTVNTHHGLIRTDHVLFIAAGAFTRNKPGDLMPELQGRFPIRVQLRDLTEEHFRRILTEPKNALTKQQSALMQTEGVQVKFTDEGIAALAKKAFELNRTQQNIGARRLYAVMEKVFEQVSFDAPDRAKKSYTIDLAYVDEHLRGATAEEDLNLFGFAAATRKEDPPPAT